MAEWNDVEVKAQLAISHHLAESFCHEGPFLLPRVNPLPPLQVAYEAIEALHAAGFEVAPISAGES